MTTKELVESCLYLAKNIANKYANRGYDYNECLSTANFILVRAATKFDQNRGIKFTTYFTNAVFNSFSKEYSVGAIRFPHNKKLKPTIYSLDLIRENIHKEKEIDDEYIKLDHLTKQEQIVIRLRYWEDKKYKEIASILKVSMQRVQKVHSIAIEKLAIRYKNSIGIRPNKNEKR